MNYTDRALFRKRELIYILFFLAAILFLYLFLSGKPSGDIVTVDLKGEKVYESELLNITQPVTLNLKGSNGDITVEINKEGALISNSCCKDQICVHTGKISKAGASIICMPEQVSVRITSKSTDAVTY